MAAYTPAVLAADLAAGAADVLPWVGAGVGGGVVLMFAFLGIRAGFRFFQGLIWDRRANDWSDADQAQWDADMARADDIIASAPRGRY
ncbi:MAG: hypothetical protein K0Q52_1895 [Microbacterium sp.]|nr:hypothetical protein [Microbacterium sp.]